jgi:alkylation response protein AidB-like acyl-CoA dehydrogenase
LACRTEEFTVGLVLDNEQTLLRQTAVDFARARLPVANLRRLRDGADATGFDRGAWREMADLGWAGMLIAEELGGNGFGYLGLGLVMESLGRTLAASPLLSTVVLSGTALSRTADSEESKALLAGIARGEAVVAFACEESPSHRPDHVATTAVRSGAGYALNGHKRFVIDGHVANRIIVVARTSGNIDERAGLSLFLVDPATSGVRRQRLEMVDSRNATDIVLDNVVVPGSSLLGREGDAADVLDAVLDRGRILLSAEMLGMAQEDFETTLAYLKQRTQFGVPIGSFQALKHRAVAMFQEIELSKSVVLEALTALDEDRPDVPRLAAACKAQVNDTLKLVSNEAVQLHGGMGVTDEIDVGLYLKRARVAQATFGNSTFQRDRFASLEGF